MVNEFTGNELADLAEKLGLNKTESLNSPLLQGDLGYSINLSVLVLTIMLFLIVMYLIKYRKKEE